MALLHSYGWGYIRRQPIVVVNRLLLDAVRRREREMAWDMWLALYPYMVIPQPGAKRPLLKFQTFNQFYQQPASPANADLTPEQIIEKFEEIKKLHQRQA